MTISATYGGDTVSLQRDFIFVEYPVGSIYAPTPSAASGAFDPSQNWYYIPSALPSTTALVVTWQVSIMYDELLSQAQSAKKNDGEIFELRLGTFIEPIDF